MARHSILCSICVRRRVVGCLSVAVSGLLWEEAQCVGVRIFELCRRGSAQFDRPFYARFRLLVERGVWWPCMFYSCCGTFGLVIVVGLPAW